MTSSHNSASRDEIKLIDIGINLTDDMFDGVYHGKSCHQSDRSAMIERAVAVGVERMIVTSGSVEDFTPALALSKSIQAIKTYTTAGIHPTRCNEFLKAKGGPSALMQQLRDIIRQGQSDGTVVAVGECGLDYDRLHFCPKDVQKRFFLEQFALAEESRLPMFLHDRNTGSDFFEIMRENRSRITGGVVHSFTGTVEEMDKLLSLDLYIGINGCSLKTEENLAAVRQLPLSRIMLETDGPWCEVKRTHAGYGHVKTHWPTKKKEKFAEGSCVNGRAEPCHIVQVLEVVAGIKGLSTKEVADAAHQNTLQLFFPSE